VNAEFSEREFEFCFNSEWVRKNRGALLGTPVIPTTRAERFKGYDVGFRIRHGRYRRSIFLQHKVPVFVNRRAGRNARFMANHPKGAYLRFLLRQSAKSPQHNTLLALAKRRPSSDVLYCVPLFHSYQSLRDYLATDQITDHSLYLPVRSMQRIADSKPHSVTLEPDASRWFFHSEPVELERGLTWQELLEHAGEGIVERIDDDFYLQRLRGDLREAIGETQHPRAGVPTFVASAGAAAEIAYLTSVVLEADWYLIP
jgi:hypothetical protein